MKVFLVELTIRCGEYEKRIRTLVEAPDADAAQEYAVLLESHDVHQLEWETNGAADMGWEFFYQYHSVQEVPEEHVPVLSEYMSKYTFNESEFFNAGNYMPWKTGIKEDDFVVLDEPLPMHSNYRKLAGKVRGFIDGKVSVNLSWGVTDPVSDDYTLIDEIVTAVALNLCRKVQDNNQTAPSTQ